MTESRARFLANVGLAIVRRDITGLTRTQVKLVADKALKLEPLPEDFRREMSGHWPISLLRLRGYEGVPRQ